MSPSRCHTSPAVSRREDGATSTSPSGTSCDPDKSIAAILLKPSRRNTSSHKKHIRSGRSGQSPLGAMMNPRRSSLISNPRSLPPSAAVSFRVCSPSSRNASIASARQRTAHSPQSDRRRKLARRRQSERPGPAEADAAVDLRPPEIRICCCIGDTPMERPTEVSPSATSGIRSGSSYSIQCTQDGAEPHSCAEHAWPTTGVPSPPMSRPSAKLVRHPKAPLLIHATSTPFTAGAEHLLGHLPMHPLLRRPRSKTCPEAVGNKPPQQRRVFLPAGARRVPVAIRASTSLVQVEHVGGTAQRPSTCRRRTWTKFHRRTV